MEQKVIKRCFPFLMLFFVFGITLLFPEFVLAGDLPISEAGTKEVDEIIKILATCVEAVGDLCMLFGVVKYGNGMASDQPKELTTGITSLVTGVILANISTVLGI